jgi:hypothetical protein
MEHFTNLARRGMPGTGASSGEIAARKLALAIAEYACSLDETEIGHALIFLRFAHAAPSMARDLIGYEPWRRTASA